MVTVQGAFRMQALSLLIRVTYIHAWQGCGLAAMMALLPQSMAGTCCHVNTLPVVRSSLCVGEGSPTNTRCSCG